MGYPDFPRATFAILACLGCVAAAAEPGTELSLNGTWDVAGADHQYTRTTVIPGLLGDPAAMAPGTTWLRRLVDLPEGAWSHARLRLKGASFAPAVYLNGRQVAASGGGMAPIDLDLPPEAAPGHTLVLEVALTSLRDLDPGDASSVPAADRWRSDVSSSLWDDVVLHLSGDAALRHVVPWPEWDQHRLVVHWEAAGLPAGATVQAEILGEEGPVARSADTPAASGAATVDLAGSSVRPWSPDSPRLYRLRVSLKQGARLADCVEMNWGWRRFRTQGLRFELNDQPVTLRGGSVVWHRWLRDPQARLLAFDAEWFDRNIVRRFKSYGANFLRFHLGLPPERLLDLCDREGLLVQAEWPFFHGIAAHQDGMERQWRSWLELASRHPSVVLVQPWNETTGDALKPAWAALDRASARTPPFVVAHRDVIPVHKYWWSLFENLGLYYDSAAQFGRPILVDEFGGNYLDYDGDPGDYPAVRESLLRFLGRDETPEARLAFEAEASARVAEYWRRIGAAGFGPFCALSSPQDGNTWFLGKLADGKPKPVWDALAAAYAPVSVSVDLWDRDFLPRGKAAFPLYFFNDTGEARDVEADVRLMAGAADGGTPVHAQRLRVRVPAHGAVTRPVTVPLPDRVGPWRIEAEPRLDPKPAHRVVSSWRIRTVAPAVPGPVAATPIAVPPDEAELKGLLQRHGLNVAAMDDPSARIVLLGRRSWERAQKEGPGFLAPLDAALADGRSVVWLDIGPRDLGQGYRHGDLGPLEGAPTVIAPRTVHAALPGGVQADFVTAAEPESHIHPTREGANLWHGLPPDAAWLWNGLRGGLIVPADTMSLGGLGANAYLALWKSRGAFAPSVVRGPYYAYSLSGYCVFSRKPHDAEAIGGLRERVRLLAEDAPSLGAVIDPAAPVVETDLHAGFGASPSQGAVRLLPLVQAGKDLTRAPVMTVGFGPGHGVLLLSQLLTDGRLTPGRAEPGEYGLRYDPAAEQFVLNLLGLALDTYAPPPR